MNIPVAHTMGGEISGTIDESIRHAVTKLAHVHFPANAVAAERIIRMGEPPESNLGRVDPEFVMRAIDRICERVEGMEEGSLHSTHVGRDGLTPDQRAIIDKAGPEGFYIACGFSGTGFKLSPAVGVCMSELILDGAAKLVDVSSLHLERFARGELLQGSYGHIWK